MIARSLPLRATGGNFYVEPTLVLLVKLSSPALGQRRLIRWGLIMRLGRSGLRLRVLAGGRALAVAIIPLACKRCKVSLVVMMMIFGQGIFAWLIYSPSLD